MQKIILDLRHITDRDALYDAIEEAFSFPAYFGRNLDALFDCLTDISEATCIGLFLPPPPDQTNADHTGAPAAGAVSFPEYLGRLQRTFLDAEAENTHLCVICLP